MGKIIALDYGERYVGVALTDSDNRMALRHSVVDQKKQDIEKVLESLIEEEDVERVLVGVPLSLSGEETNQTHVSLQFIERMRTLFEDVDIEGVDETLTSVEAERRIKSEGAKPIESHAEAARMMLEDRMRLGI